MIELFFVFALLVGYNLAQNPECMQPIDPGDCYGYFPRFGYNVTSSRCERFIYGGCEGNSNNFETLTECENTCYSPCFQPIERGPCHEAILRYGFNVDMGRCMPFVYGGCEGNSNNFRTMAECQATCEEPSSDSE